MGHHFGNYENHHEHRRGHYHPELSPFQGYQPALSPIFEQQFNGYYGYPTSRYNPEVYGSPFEMNQIANRNYNFGYRDGYVDAENGMNDLFNNFNQGYPYVNEDICNNNQQNTFMAGMMTGLALILAKLGIGNDNQNQQTPQGQLAPTGCTESNDSANRIAELESKIADLKEINLAQKNVSSGSIVNQQKAINDDREFANNVKELKLKFDMAKFQKEQQDAAAKNDEKPVKPAPAPKHKPAHNKVAKKEIHQEIKPNWSTNAKEHAQEMKDKNNWSTNAWENTQKTIDKISNPVESP